jgi:hypothetical protein
MRFSTVLSFVAMAVIAPVASSHEPPPKPRDLGAASAVFDFCSRVDHDDDKIFDAGSERLYHGMTRDEIERIRHSEEFRQAYSTLESVLKELPPNDARAACKAIGPATLGKFNR